MTTKRTPGIANCAGLFSNCATSVPTALDDAREAYRRSRAGGSGRFVSTEHLAAAHQLAEAERAYERAPDSEETRDLAFAALRAAELAEAAAYLALTGEGRRRRPSDDHRPLVEVPARAKRRLA